MAKAVDGYDRRNPGAEIALFMTSNQQDPERGFLSSLGTNEVVAMINRLPPEFRQVVLLSDLEELRYAEIAERLAVPIGTVKSRLFRGRRLLQERLYPYAIESGVVRKSDAATSARRS
jgi:RNA polymerase sigma-70 factor (ECF subfamily)